MYEAHRMAACRKEETVLNVFKLKSMVQDNDTWRS